MSNDKSFFVVHNFTDGTHDDLYKVVIKGTSINSPFK